MLVPLGIAEGGMGRAMEDRMFAEHPRVAIWE